MGGGVLLLALSLPPIIKNEPHWVGEGELQQRRQGTKLWRAWSSHLSAWKAHISGWFDSRQQKGEPKMPSLLLQPQPMWRCVATCCTLRTTPPPLAGVGGHREFDPQCLAAARRMVDRGVYYFIDGVEQAGDILQNRRIWSINQGSQFSELISSHISSLDHQVQKILQNPVGVVRQSYTIHIGTYSHKSNRTSQLS